MYLLPSSWEIPVRLPCSVSIPSYCCVLHLMSLCPVRPSTISSEIRSSTVSHCPHLSSSLCSVVLHSLLDLFPVVALCLCFDLSLCLAYNGHSLSLAQCLLCDSTIQTVLLFRFTVQPCHRGPYVRGGSQSVHARTHRAPTTPRLRLRLTVLALQLRSQGFLL